MVDRPPLRWIVAGFLMAALIGCGNQVGEPGTTEVRGDATVYHLEDGAFIHEFLNGTNHYYLVDRSVKSFELVQDGLSAVVATMVEDAGGVLPRALR